MTPGREGKHYWITIVSIIVVGVAIDQIVKAVVVDRLVPGQPVKLVSDIFELLLMRNSGAAFSSGPGLTVVFSILAVVVLVAVAIWIVPKIQCQSWAVAIGLGMAGVAGNLVDRLVRAPGPFRGQVVDFFALKYFAVFNVADVMLTAAAVMIVVFALFKRIDFNGRPIGTTRSRN
jgi:signal peptidase II